MENQEGPTKDRRGLSRLASEHKLFSGFAGSLLIGGIALIALIAGSQGGSSPGTTGAEEQGGAVSPTQHQTTTNPEIPDDTDGDGLPDTEDECSEVPGGKTNGCPAAAGGLALSDFIEKSDDAYFEGGEREYLKTMNVETGQVTVGGIIDPLGVSMEVSGPEAGAFTISTNGAFERIEGRVGVTTEPCSGGPVAYVAIRNSEGEPLWPESGKLREVRRTAVPFTVRVDAQSAVVLYAQAPESRQSCDEYTGRTAVGWVHTRLSAAG